MYPWVLSFHLIAIVAWFAALFYLPRLFVYHAYALEEGDDTGCQRFQVMERKLYRGIMVPAMVCVVVLGLWLVVLNPAVLQQGWFYTKAALVVVLIGFHHMCLAHLKRFANGGKTRRHVFYRFFNEVPTIVLVAVVILTVVKPF